MDGENVFKTICAGFNVTPTVCYDDYDEATGSRSSSGGINKWLLLVIVIVVIIINIVLICCYRRYSRREMKKEMQLQISSVMSQYFAINDSKETQKVVSAVPDTSV